MRFHAGQRMLDTASSSLASVAFLQLMRMDLWQTIYWSKLANHCLSKTRDLLGELSIVERLPSPRLIHRPIFILISSWALETPLNSCCQWLARRLAESLVRLQKSSTPVSRGLLAKRCEQDSILAYLPNSLWPTMTSHKPWVPNIHGSVLPVFTKGHEAWAHDSTMKSITIALSQFAHHCKKVSIFKQSNSSLKIASY